MRRGRAHKSWHAQARQDHEGEGVCERAWLLLSLTKGHWEMRTQAARCMMLLLHLASGNMCARFFSSVVFTLDFPPLLFARHYNTQRKAQFIA